MKEHFQTVEEMINKTGQTCKECIQQKSLVPDFEAPERYILQAPSGGFKSYIIGWPLKYADDGLCYFHRKKKAGLFDCKTQNQMLREGLSVKIQGLNYPTRH